MKAKILYIFLISIFILSSCGNEETGNIETPKKQVKTTIVKKEVFTEDIKLIGKVDPNMQTPISAQVGGVINKINVGVGEEVKAGDVLATIDLSSSTYGVSFNNANTAYNNSLNSYSYTEEAIKNDLEAAKVQLDSAISTKENTYITTEKQLELAQTQLNNIKTTKQNTISTTEESVKSAELLVKNAETSLTNFEKSSKTNFETIYSNIQVLASSFESNSENILDSADILLGISKKNMHLNDSYEVYLGAKDSKTKTESEIAYASAKKIHDEYMLMGESTNDELEKKIYKAEALIKAEATMFEKIITMLNYSITSTSFPQTQLDTIKANNQKGQSSVLALQSQITGLKNSLQQAITQTETQRDSLNNALSIALSQLQSIKAGNTTQLDSISGNEALLETQLETTIATIKQSRQAVDNGVKIAQANYDSINAKLNSQKIQAKSMLDSAKGGKDLAYIGLNNTNIIAPFDGVISGKNIEIGTMIGPGSPAFMISFDEAKIIKLEVSGDNVKNFSIGQNIKIVRNNQSYSGTISVVSPSSDSLTKLYKLEALITSDSKDLVLGEFVDVYIKKEYLGEEYILAPFSAIISRGQGDFSVFVVGEDSKVTAKTVKLGSQNSEHVVIESGISEGDKIVISGALNLQDGDYIKE